MFLWVQSSPVHLSPVISSTQVPPLVETSMQWLLNVVCYHHMQSTHQTSVIEHKWLLCQISQVSLTTVLKLTGLDSQNEEWVNKPPETKFKHKQKWNMTEHRILLGCKCSLMMWMVLAIVTCNQLQSHQSGYARLYQQPSQPRSQASFLSLAVSMCKEPVKETTSVHVFLAFSL